MEKQKKKMERKKKLERKYQQQNQHKSIIMMLMMTTAQWLINSLNFIPMIRHCAVWILFIFLLKIDLSCKMVCCSQWHTEFKRTHTYWNQWKNIFYRKTRDFHKEREKKIWNNFSERVQKRKTGIKPIKLCVLCNVYVCELVFFFFLRIFKSTLFSGIEFQCNLLHPNVYRYHICSLFFFFFSCCCLVFRVCNLNSWTS